MISFDEWLVKEGLFDFVPNMGQRAIPINQHGNQAPAPQTKQISLRSLSSNVQNPDWHFLYDIFERQFNRNPQDTNVVQLGQALHQSATTNNYSLLNPFKQKHLQAQRIQ